MVRLAAFVGIGWIALTGLSTAFVMFLALRGRQSVAKPSPASARPNQHSTLHGAARPPFEARELDFRCEVSAALAELHEVAQHYQIGLQVAVQPDLTLWADPRALRQMLTGILSQAAQRTEGGAVLVSAAWHGGRVQVTVVDDGPAGDEAVLLGRLREVAQCAALQGGTLEIECRRVSGNRVVLRMPGIGAPDASASDDELWDEAPAHGARRTGALGAS